MHTVALIYAMQIAKLRLKILEHIKDGMTALSLRVANNIDFLHAFINMAMLINPIYSN